MNYTLLIALLGIVVVFMSLLVSQFFNRKKERQYDRVINATNYNINMIDEKRIDKLTSEEAQKLIDEIKKSELTSISHRDFFALKEKVNAND